MLRRAVRTYPTNPLAPSTEQDDGYTTTHSTRNAVMLARQKR
jgi:hypothetical protein